MADTPTPGPRLRALLTLATTQGGVVSRRQLYARGVSRGEVRNNVRACRWRTIGRHCLVLHTGPLPMESHWWVAVIEGGPRAFLDGETALIASGLTGYASTVIRVSIPRGARIRHRHSAYDIRQTRRWAPADVVQTGLPRAQPPIAAIRAALWARSDRQATLLLTMTVQQHLASVPDLSRQLLRVRRDRRRALIATTLLDLAGGIGSLSELDVLRGCRSRGLPEPDLQSLRRTRGGSYFLDFRWQAYGVVLEVDGIQHAWAEHLVGDALRHNSVAMSGDMVLRLPVLGLRTCPEDFFGQLAEALQRRGWHRAA
jgi:very-short-patch-repair endonuclease